MAILETRGEYPSINVVTRSNATTNKDKWKQLATNLWIRKAPKNQDGFYLQHAKYTYVQA